WHCGFHDGHHHSAGSAHLAVFVPGRDARIRRTRQCCSRTFIIPGCYRKERSMSLAGLVALVTGASQGIGRACAVRLASAGAAVAVAARNQTKLDELVSEIKASGGNAAAFPLDVSDEEQIKSTFKSVLGKFTKIDILVNNAGITRDQLIMRMKRADWDMVLNTNLTSAYCCIQQ